MIDRDEILIYAKRRGVDPFFIENDYLQHIALICIYYEFSNELIFKGGTALQKIYGLDRLSLGLDFNLLEGEINQKLVRAVKRMNDYYPSSIADSKKIKHGIGYKVHIESPSSGVIGMPHILPLTFNTEEKLAMKPDFRTINPGMVYKDPDLRTYSLLVMNIVEIMAEKSRALVTRKEVKPVDLYDLWFLLNSGFELDTGLVRKKIEYDHASFSMERLKARIDEIKLLWMSDLKPLTKKLLGYEEVLKAVLSAFHME